jgi:hypothetical protein
MAAVTDSFRERGFGAAWINQEGSVALASSGGRKTDVVTHRVRTLLRRLPFPREVIAVAVRWYLRYAC